MKKLKPIIIFLVLLTGMAIFPYIPMTIFRFTLDNFSQKMRIIYSFVCDLGYIIIIFMIYQKQTIKEIKAYFKNFTKHFKQSFGYYLVGFIIMLVSNNLITMFVDGATASNEIAVRSLIQKYPYYMFFSVAIYAPFVEETIFRRGIKDCLLAFNNKKYMKYIYIIVSGFIFGAMHIIGQTSSNLDYLFIIPYMALGSAFATIYYKTDNLMNTISLHALHNIIAIVLYLWLGV